MANFQVGNSSNHNVLNWERSLNREVLKMTQFMNWVGAGMDAGIKVVGDALRGQKPSAAGDTVYTTLLVNLSGDGVAGDSNLQGNEESMTLHRQTVTINQLRHGVKSDGRVTNQRTYINFQTEARQVLQKWAADTQDFWGANQLGGISTGLSSNNKAGMQTPTAPSSATGNMRIIYGPGDVGHAAGSQATTEASLSVSHTADKFFRLPILDVAVSIAETSTPAIEPIQTPMGPKYVAILHPHQIKDLRTYAAAGEVTWYDYSKSKIEGGTGRGKDLIGNPMKGALGEYNNVLIFSDSRVPLAPSRTRVRRAIFFGAQAASLAFGADSALKGDQKGLRFRYDEQEEDYKNRLGIGVRVMGGMKKNVYNSIDHATIVLSTYAA